MPIEIAYSQPWPTTPARLPTAAVWRIAALVRRQVLGSGEGLALPAERLAQAAREVCVNGRTIRVAWDLAGPVHDADGRPVLGVCETDPDLPETAVVSINGSLLAGRPDLASSTAAHELAHVLFDVPPVLADAAPARRYRSALSSASALFDPTMIRAEWRANEFMGALLAPPIALHLRLVVHARAERLRMVYGVHHGRAGSRILAADNSREAIEGVLAAAAADFGVSERFVAVRVARYRLIKGGWVP
ncbi:ImmA/IrrE family metallo-endopeptidase [Falsiroseomonas sp. HW251]|uniref:ImmA/IrrE family metallo-endopeptidase n=1 Tax=Falsiroseomonas sp. HW251 TaxID=3390998 RepID=UPI003D3224BE